jgi:hypothetical protein
MTSKRHSKLKKLPAFRSDRDAIHSVRTRDLTGYDLKGVKPVRRALETALTAESLRRVSLRSQ